MKTKILPVIICAVFTGYAINSNAQNANTDLSNLVAPTKVNVNLLPDKDNKRELGSSTKAWKNLYIDSAVYLNRNKFISNPGISNIFIGEFAGRANTTGLDNTANGYDALASNTTGNENTVTGMFALSSGTNSSLNTANGYSAMEYGGGGYYNTAIGGYALFNNYGNSNTALGAFALVYNLYGNYNVAVGMNALSSSDGDHLVAVGDSALYNLNGGSGHCTAIGSQAGIKNTTGSDNTFLGYHAGNNVIDGSQNTYLGADANSGTAGHITNATALGYAATVTSNNHIRIGNASITSIGGQVGWTSFSDERIKTNIKENVPGLVFINLLKPVTYNFNIDKQQEIMGKKDPANWNGRYDIQKIQFTGFLAQEVEAAAEKINYDFSGVDVPKTDNDIYGLRYGDFVVPLVKAVQELSTQNDSLKSEIGNLKSEMEELKSMIVSNQSTVNSQQSMALSSASLSQNIPNPFSNSTTINYSLPVKFSSAKIIITDKNGDVIKQINLSATKGSVSVDALILSSGAYNYSLIVDGKLITSKQMVSIK